jgi:hypothetical protein
MKLKRRQKVTNNLFHIDALAKGLPNGVSLARCGEFFHLADRNPRDKSCPKCFDKHEFAKYVWDDKPELPKEINEVTFEPPMEG